MGRDNSGKYYITTYGRGQNCISNKAFDHSIEAQQHKAQTAPGGTILLYIRDLGFLKTSLIAIYFVTALATLVR